MARQEDVTLHSSLVAIKTPRETNIHVERIPELVWPVLSSWDSWQGRSSVTRRAQQANRGGVPKGTWAVTVPSQEEGTDVQMSGVSGGYLPFLEDDFPFLEEEGDFPFCFLAALTFLRSRLASLTSFLFA